MRWQRGTSDADIEDRRGLGGAGPRRGGGLRLGLGGLIVVGLLSLVFKQDFFSLLDQAPGTMQDSAPTAAPPRATSAAEDERFEFIKFVLNDTQDVWTTKLSDAGRAYRRATLVVFRAHVESACGAADAASGPFYCPADEKVYIDLAFYDELRERFGAAGDFAQAYVMAHEIGHHVQNITGTDAEVRRMQEANPRRENDLSVRMELQADCYAGIWAHSTASRNLLETGDIEEALNAAAAVGDDHIQQMATGRVKPDTFTHGSSAQRVAWFRRGFEGGRADVCDTFSSR